MFQNKRGVFILLSALALFAPLSADDTPGFYRHAITFVHPHTATTAISKASPADPQMLQATELQLPQTTDFGTFRLQYAYQNALWGLSPWVAFGGNLHKGFRDYHTAGNPQKTEATAKLGPGILAGVQYRFDFSRFFYLMPMLGYGHYFSSQIDIDFPQTGATQANGCHEICVNGSIESLVYSVAVGLRLTRFLAFEVGLEHNLFWSQRNQAITDGTMTVTANQGTQFSDALMFSFGLTFQFNL